MRTSRELLLLVAETGQFWVRRLPVLGFWLCIGWAGRELAIQASVLLGTNRIPATLAFVAAMVIWVVCLVMMLYAATGDRPSYHYARQAHLLSVADAGQERSVRLVLVEAVVPFLAVYSAWGLTEDHIQRVFDANLIHYGIDALSFSITYAAWQLYLGFAVAAWVIQGLLEIGFGGRGGVPVALLRIGVRGVAILTAFMGLDALAQRGLEWAYGRQFWAWGRGAWEGFLGLWPDWRLWWDQTIPEALRSAANALWNYVVPGFWEAILIPLVWLALTATVVGWQDFGRGVAPGRLATSLTTGATSVQHSRYGRWFAAATKSGPMLLVDRWVRGQLADLLPAVQAFRLILRSGWAFVAAYLLVGAVLRELPGKIVDGLFYLIGPNDFATTMRYSSLLELVGTFFGWTLAIAFYAVAFDRAMAAVIVRQQASVAAEPRRQPVVQ